jgi:hypothetical protein
MTNYEGAPLDAAADPDFNGRKAAPGVPYVDRTNVPNADRIREVVQRKGAPLTQAEIEAVMKQG